MNARLVDVRLDRLDSGPNVRRRADAGLAKSIAEHGVLQPITVCRRGARFEVLYGHRRTAAARAVGLRTIPALWIAPPDDLPIRQIIENVDRQRLNPVDVARALREHLDTHPGLNQTDLAKSLGRSDYWVSRKLALLELEPETRARVELGRLGENRALNARIDAGPARKGRPRILQGGSERGRSRSIVVPIGSRGARAAQATIGVDLEAHHVDLVIEDGSGHSLMFSLAPDEAKLLGRRLMQAWEAVSA